MAMASDEATSICAHWFILGREGKRFLKDGIKLSKHSTIFCGFRYSILRLGEGDLPVDADAMVHSDRAIPSSNIDLHSAHCARNLEKCKVCGDMVPKRHAEDHYLNTHAPVACSLCSVTVARDSLDVHTGEQCPQRIATCEYCEFPLPAIDMSEHQEVCGNRTENCDLCRKYVRLRDRVVHETICTGVHNDTARAAPSRDVRPPVRERPHRPPQGRPRNMMEKRHLLFTIAITGIAVVLGSFFFQEKIDSTELH